MTALDPYNALLAHRKETAALDQIAGLLSWDQEAVMPRRGAAQRAEQARALAAVIHAHRTDPRIGDWLAAIDADALDDAGRANLRLMRRAYGRATRLPAALTSEIASATVEAHQIWAEARARDDAAMFLPVLERIVALRRDYAACLADDSETLYDALMGDFEDGADQATTANIFDRLRAGLTDLRARIAESGMTAPVLAGHFPAPQQLALARRLAGQFGYDFEAGRIDQVVHPFCSGTRGDVRLTTRVDEANPLDCLYSTLHETGHALYEQGLPEHLAWQPAGEHVSMGVHESQSRLCENQIGRSRAFCTWLYGEVTTAFGDTGLDRPAALYRAVNRVAPGFIRTEADEVHYNLHIMLRFDLERALIAGDLSVPDLEAAWNDRFEADFGVAVDRPSNGMLQDVHWSAGLFGYFPTYTLGNIYAACLATAMAQALPPLSSDLARGDLSGAVGWLRTHVHAQAATSSPVETITRACGAPPDETALLGYLDAKFGELYGV